MNDDLQPDTDYIMSEESRQQVQYVQVQQPVNQLVYVLCMADE